MSDPFDTLGVEPRFDLDPKALSERHRELSKALHPDRYVNAAPAERRMALGRAIEVNQAFRTLKDSLARSEALAKRLGLAVGEGKEGNVSPALLMEMMEGREALAEAAQQKDLAALARLGGEMTSRKKDVEAKLGAAFGENTTEVVALLGELRYVRRFLDEVAAFEEALMS